MMRSESTSALGQPRETKPTRGCAGPAGRDFRAGLVEGLTADFGMRACSRHQCGEQCLDMSTFGSAGRRACAGSRVREGSGGGGTERGGGGGGGGGGAAGGAPRP